MGGGYFSGFFRWLLGRVGAAPVAPAVNSVCATLAVRPQVNATLAVAGQVNATLSVEAC